MWSECETESILADTNGTESATTGGASEAKDLGADSPVKAQGESPVCLCSGLTSSAAAILSVRWKLKIRHNVTLNNK